MFYADLSNQSIPPAYLHLQEPQTQTPMLDVLAADQELYHPVH
jgi:hypothetical protein